MSAPSAESSREKHERVGSEDDRRVSQHVCRKGRRGDSAERLERDPARANDRAVVQTRGFGPFCGDEGPNADTDDGCGDPRDGREKGAGEEGEDHRDGQARECRAPDDLGSRS